MSFYDKAIIQKTKSVSLTVFKILIVALFIFDTLYLVPVYQN